MKNNKKLITSKFVCWVRLCTEYRDVQGSHDPQRGAIKNQRRVSPTVRRSRPTLQSAERDRAAPLPAPLGNVPLWLASRLRPACVDFGLRVFNTGVECVHFLSQLLYFVLPFLLQKFFIGLIFFFTPSSCWRSSSWFRAVGHHSVLLWWPLLCSRLLPDCPCPSLLATLARDRFVLTVPVRTLCSAPPPSYREPH